jgi:hypothetical protein
MQPVQHVSIQSPFPSGVKVGDITNISATRVSAGATYPTASTAAAAAAKPSAASQPQQQQQQPVSAGVRAPTPQQQKQQPQVGQGPGTQQSEYVNISQFSSQASSPPPPLPHAGISHINQSFFISHQEPFSHKLSAYCGQDENRAQCFSV